MFPVLIFAGLLGIKKKGHHPLWGKKTTLPVLPARMSSKASSYLSKPLYLWVIIGSRLSFPLWMRLETVYQVSQRCLPVMPWTSRALKIIRLLKSSVTSRGNRPRRDTLPPGVVALRPC